MTRLIALATLIPGAALAHSDVVPHVHAGDTALTPVLAIAAAVALAGYAVWRAGSRPE